MAFNGVVAADKPVEPSHGLFSVAEVDNRGSRDEHWIGGYYVESAVCGRKISTEALCNSTSGADIQTVFDSSDAERFFHVTPFGIIETLECDNSIGFKAMDGRAQVIKQLKSVTEFAVEMELMHGVLAQNDSDTQAPATRWLNNGTDVTPTPGTAVEAIVALGLVENAFASNNPGVRATIHMSALMATVLKSALDERGDILYTNTGSVVAINRGGDSEDGIAAGGSTVKHWIYATGPVHVDLGNEELITVSVSEIVNATTNKVTYTAERPAAVYFDGCSWYGALADATL